MSKSLPLRQAPKIKCKVARPEKALRRVSANAIVVPPGRGSGRLRAMAAFIKERVWLSEVSEGVLMRTEIGLFLYGIPARTIPGSRSHQRR